MEKYIAITKENREFLMKTFRTTPMSVWRALYYNNDTELSKKIRYTAIKRGGILMAVTPWMETLHDSDGYMRQYFPNGVLIECNKNNGDVEVIKNGETVNRYERVSISQLEDIQNLAKNL